MAAGAIARVGASSLDDISRVVVNWFRSVDKSTVSKVAARLGVTGKLTSSKVGEMVKNNKLTAAFVLYEMGNQGAPYLEELMANDQQVRDVVEFIREGDLSREEVGELADDVPSQETMEIISRGIGVVGSHQRLLDLKKALDVEDKDHINYDRVRSLGRSLR